MPQTHKLPFAIICSVIFALFFLAGCDGPNTYHGHFISPNVDANSVGTGKDSPQSLVGERLFRENRFSQYFYANANGDLNRKLAHGDPVVDTVESIDRVYSKGPYKGQAISCASCHFVDQNKNVRELGVRAYTDYSRRSRIPDRGDGMDRTVRNSPVMVGSAIKDGLFLHHDGEFTRPEDLIHDSYLGRNMGWLPDEDETAIHHIAEVVRHDNGTYPTDTPLAGLRYRDLLAGAEDTIPPHFRVPRDLRFQIDGASDHQIFEAVIRLVGQYLRSLDFARDADGRYNGSPFDAFLRKNGLPLAAIPGESPIEYSDRLANLVNGLKHPRFVSDRDGQFNVQKQRFVFGAEELDGFKTFFGSGRCTRCHAPPDFTDHLFHNTGASQAEYDQVHGSGSFMKFSVPTLGERRAHPELYLPASIAQPRALSLMRSSPSTNDLRRADLGAWAVLFNPDMPKPQTLLRSAICQSLNLNCTVITDDELLSASLGMVKTPTLRDLGQSWPYLHTGQADRIEDVIHFYATYSNLARSGQVRNADPHLSEIHLEGPELDNLARFLNSLNEDYN